MLPHIDASILFDALKWFAGGVAGYLLREWKDFGKRRRLRANLYRELSHNYEELVHVLTVVEQKPYLGPVFPGNARLTLGYYNHAITTGKELFHDLPDCSVLKSLADDLAKLGASGLTRSNVHDGMMFVAHVEKAIHDGHLNGRLFKQVSSSTARKWVTAHEGSKKLFSVGKTQQELYEGMADHGLL